MKAGIRIFSVLFAAIGFLPFKWAWKPNTTVPNQIIVSQQSCGCPCPNGTIVQGVVAIPEDIKSKYPSIHQSEINFQTDGITTRGDPNLDGPNLYLKGEVVGADTIHCSPTGCEIAPRFAVKSWGFTEYSPVLWTFPKWIFLAYAINLVFIAPLIIMNGLFQYLFKRGRRPNH